ncbi:uncharacterized protein LOC125178626, partial [Hyalella azteca]|uniref:Uncharacterized protein LOC125178626 n=1 Tax=Hyalella azteca TaxID=294128 RepID=A0A979FRP5_HYAAZ
MLSAAQDSHIEFGVGPNDPRYFAGRGDTGGPHLQPYNLQERSRSSLKGFPQDPDSQFGLQNPRLEHDDPQRKRQDLNFLLQDLQSEREDPRILRQDSQFGVNYPQFGVQDPQFGVQDRQFGVQDPQFGVQDSQFGVQDPQFGVQDPQFGVQDPHFGRGGPRIPSQDQQLVSRMLDLYDDDRADLNDQLALADLLAGLGQDRPDDRSAAFMQRLRAVLRAGDRETARRMLGGPAGHVVVQLSCSSRSRGSAAQLQFKVTWASHRYQSSSSLYSDGQSSSSPSSPAPSPSPTHIPPSTITMSSLRTTSRITYTSSASFQSSFTPLTKRWNSTQDFTGTVPCPVPGHNGTLGTPAGTPTPTPTTPSTNLA